MRATTEQLSQVTNLLAIVSAPPIADDHDPPRRGAAAPAPGRDGRGDHLHRRRHEARDQLRRSRSTRGSSTGRTATSTRCSAGMALGARMMHSKLLAPSSAEAERGFLRRSRPPSPSSSRPPRTTSTSAARSACSSEDRLQELSQIGGLMQLLERRVAILSMLPRGARGAARLPAHRDRERDAGAALGERRRRQLRRSEPQPRRRQRARAGAHGLPDARSCRVRAAAAELSRFVQRPLRRAEQPAGRPRPY